MNLFKFSLLSLFLSLSLIFTTPSFAIETPATSQSITVATVNLERPRIVSQNKNTFNIAFGLSNREGLQGGVKYGITLVSDNGKYVVDEKVYEESLTLNENTTIKRDIIYSAPSNLGGSYTLVISSRNENNFPFASVSLGKVKLEASTKGVQILNDSCYLQVEGEKGSPRYTLMQNVDITSNESLKLTCSGVNETSAPITLTPFFETRYASVYGKIAPQSGGSFTPVVFAKNEKKTFSVVLPKGDIPQFYALKIALMSSDVTSNSVFVNYIVSGDSATIQKVSLDKDYYKAGDNGELSIMWSVSTSNFARSETKYAKLPEITMKATITGENGRECIEPIEKVLVRDAKSPSSGIAFEIKATCMNPKVSASLIDNKENVLDQKEFNFKSSTTDGPTPISKKTIIIIIVVLLAILAVGFYMKKRRSNVTM